jgi:hypothetical protein
MERAKRISTQSLVIAILSLLLVASLIMTATGAWFVSSDTAATGDLTFGAIELGSLVQTGDGDAAVMTVNYGEPDGDVIMPGDSIDVNFQLLNSGTAAMWVRFKVTLVDSEGHATETVNGQLPGGFTLGTIDGYMYKDAYIENGAAALNVDFVFNIPTSVGEAAEGDTVSLALAVEAVQVANNGALNLDTDGGDDSTIVVYS